MSTYEKYSLIVQIVSTVIVVATIYYAGKSFFLSKLDYDRRVRLDTLGFLDKLITNINVNGKTLLKIKNVEFDKIEENEKLRTKLSSTLNYFEWISIVLKENTYHNDLILNAIRNHLMIIKDCAMPYINYKRRKNNNPSLFKGISELINQIEGRT